jgi:hypothetical protein
MYFFLTTVPIARLLYHNILFVWLYAYFSLRPITSACVSFLKLISKSSVSGVLLLTVFSESRSQRQRGKSRELFSPARMQG